MSRQRPGGPPGLPPELLALAAAARPVVVSDEGPPARMLEARIYSPGAKPGDEPIAVLEERQIAGHDPSVCGVVEMVDARTNRRRFWIGFPYTVLEEPHAESGDDDRRGGPLVEP